MRRNADLTLGSSSTNSTLPDRQRLMSAPRSLVEVPPMSLLFREPFRSRGFKSARCRFDVYFRYFGGGRCVPGSDDHTVIHVDNLPLCSRFAPCCSLTDR